MASIETGAIWKLLNRISTNRRCTCGTIWDTGLAMQAKLGAKGMHIQQPHDKVSMSSKLKPVSGVSKCSMQGTSQMYPQSSWAVEGLGWVEAVLPWYTVIPTRTEKEEIVLLHVSLDAVLTLKLVLDLYLLKLSVSYVVLVVQMFPQEVALTCIPFQLFEQPLHRYCTQVLFPFTVHIMNSLNCLPPDYSHFCGAGPEVVLPRRQCWERHMWC